MKKFMVVEPIYDPDYYEDPRLTDILYVDCFDTKEEAKEFIDNEASSYISFNEVYKNRRVYILDYIENNIKIPEDPEEYKEFLKRLYLNSTIKPKNIKRHLYKVLDFGKFINQRDFPDFDPPRHKYPRELMIVEVP